MLVAYFSGFLSAFYRFQSYRSKFLSPWSCIQEYSTFVSVLRSLFIQSLHSITRESNSSLNILLWSAIRTNHSSEIGEFVCLLQFLLVDGYGHRLRMSANVLWRVDRPSPPRSVRVDCQSTEMAEVFWFSGPSNNAPISEFRVYYRDWSPDAQTSPPFNRSALILGANPKRRADSRYIV